MAKAFYAWIVYPESSPIEDLRLWMDTNDFNYAISPLHDKDVWDTDDEKGGHKKGDLKKAHYHVLLGWSDKPLSKTEFKKLAKQAFPDVSLQLEDVFHGSAMVDYLSHKGTPTKAQYDANDIIYSDFWDVEEYETKAERKKNAKKERVLSGVPAFVKLINDRNILEYCDFVEIIANEFPEKLDEFCSLNHIIKPYIDSRRFSDRDAKKENVDSECAILKDEIEECKKFSDYLLEKLISEMYWKCAYNGILHADAEKLIISQLSDIWCMKPVEINPIALEVIEKWRKMQNA